MANVMKKSSSLKMKNRMKFILLGFMTLGFGVISVQLFMLQIVRGEELQQMAMDQQTRANTLGARRGVIYDRNFAPLAESATVWNICISPAELNPATLDKVAGDLAEILDIGKEGILEAAARRQSYYCVIKRRVDRTEVDKVIAYYTNPDNPVTGIFHEQDTKRFYRYGSLASNILGFTNYDGDGAYGLEAFYNTTLSGTPGMVLSTKDAKGADMNVMHSRVFDATDGNSIVLTIDETIQHYLERNLETAVIEHNIGNRAVGIVMDVKTGGIIAMSTKPDFDPNNPFILTDPNAIRRLALYEEGTEEFTETRQNLLYDQWRNKAISDPYEPGSVFKIITAAVALDNRLVSMNDHFNCSYTFQVANVEYHCWQRRGHGSQDFIKAMQNSCNPAFIMVGQRIGAGTFYNYIESFGLRERTGIDLPGEALGIGHSLEILSKEGRVELASTSFGQTMKVTPLQMINSATAAVNGGYLMQPFIVKQVLDPNGNIIQTIQPVVRRQVISAQASAEMRTLTEAVVHGGSGRFAAIPGFRIGGKTGTSQKLDQEEGHILSFVGFAPMEDPQIACLVMLDEPELDDLFGSTIAAPVVGAVLNEVLPYLGIQPQFTAEELAQTEVQVPDLVGRKPHDAQAELRTRGLGARLIGNGGEVIRQIPLPGQTMQKGATVYLYTESGLLEAAISIPDVVGLGAQEANTELVGLGFNIELRGVLEDGVPAVVAAQWPDAGTLASEGDKVILTLERAPEQQIVMPADSYVPNVPAPG
jgi:stage V sporulation protein D (sporulation-specific penicillin-binding protein)